MDKPELTVTATLAATNTLSASDTLTAPLVNLASGDWDAQSCTPNLVLMSALPLPQLSLNSTNEAVGRPMAGVSLLGDGPVCHIVEERDDCKTLTLPIMTTNPGSLHQPFNVCSTVSSDCSMPSPSSLHLTSPKKNAITTTQQTPTTTATATTTATTATISSNAFTNGN
uniref:Uncharacterized protein n=1 Tax=Glossina brevipalpis TaxID=37001 RepID=A0A1A9WYX9_9MUSC